MPSTFFGLDIAVSGMHAYGAALNTTGHNVSNIGTKGYTKQTVIQTASDAYSVGASYGMLGTVLRQQTSCLPEIFTMI